MRNGFLRTMVAFAATIVFISSADARVVRTLDSGWKFALTGDNAASSDFDIASEVGVYAPLVERFEVDVKGNEGIVVEFRPRKGSPVLNAISIRKNY